ncbi:MAG: hypothetical protein JXB14_06550 [Candidatus Altiarchaeota archaeon]|nr:hypothetical protein [Candidatus Altiarchaeota archaeon]
MTKPERSERITNLVVNATVMMMGSIMISFGDLMAGFTGAMGEAMINAFGSDDPESKKRTEEMKREIREKMPEGMKKMLGERMVEVTAKMREKRGELEGYFKDPLFDEGLAIVDRYRFNLPPLTEELSMEDMAGYLCLGQSNDKKLDEMMHELGLWMNKVGQKFPTPPS